MKAKHKYVSIEPNELGDIHYDSESHKTWSTLYSRQREHIKNRACIDYINGLELIGFNDKEIPQHKLVSHQLHQFHGWGVQQVPALIPATEFFTLLSNKKFPAASFIRLPHDLDYIMEPDIFHEFFGHCPLLTNKAYSEFMHAFGRIALEAKPKDRVQLFRLFWFTIEFGLIKTSDGIRAYGGGILSSFGETTYALESTTPEKIKFDPIEALRTPYRIDILQPIYYVIESFEELFHIIDQDLMKLLEKARELGDHPARFELKK
jgi:phenylalanine-4-hydroxylase